MMLACAQEKVFLQTVYLDPFRVAVFFSSFKNLSKIQPKSAIIAFFLFFFLLAPPYFSFPFPPLV